MAEEQAQKTRPYDQLSDSQKSQFNDAWKETLNSQTDEDAFVGQFNDLIGQVGTDNALDIVGNPQAIAPKKPTWYEDIGTGVLKGIHNVGYMANQGLKSLEPIPVIGPMAKGVENVENLANKGMDWWRQNYNIPVSLTAGQLFDPTIKEKLAGRGAGNIPIPERNKIWEESKLPWLGKTAIEMGTDPTTYIGWGIPGVLEEKALGAGLETAVRAGMVGKSEEIIQAAIKAAKMAQKTGELAPDLLKAAKATGMGTISQAIHPFTRAEDALNYVGNLPIKAAGAAWKGTLGKITALSLEESAKSMVGRMPLHVADAFNNLQRAGEHLATPKPLSQILDEIATGNMDKELARTITNPKQQLALNKLEDYVKSDPNFKLTLEGARTYADKVPYKAANDVGQLLAAKLAKELHVKPNIVDASSAAKVAKLANQTYGIWKKMVLNTPWYVQQVFGENAFRQMMVGSNPFFEMKDIVARADVSLWPIEIQRKMIGIVEGLHPTKSKLTLLERTAQAGAGPTEATLGQWTGGWENFFANLAQGSDRHTVIGIFVNSLDRNMKLLMQNAAPETAKAYAAINSMREDLIRSGVPATLADHLIETAQTKPVSVFMQEMEKVTKNAHYTVARPINDTEEAVTWTDRQYINQSVESAWNRGKRDALGNTFDQVEKNIPLRINEYHREAMIRQAKAVRDQIVAAWPKQQSSYIRYMLRRVSYARASERDAEMLAAKSYSGLQDARFEANLNARREVGDMANAIAISNMRMNNATDRELDTYFTGVDRLTQTTRMASDSFRQLTRDIADTVGKSNNATKIQEAWQSFIKEVQSTEPELATQLMLATPDTDLLWNTYFQMQEKRWWSLGQDQMELAGIPRDSFLSTKNPRSGKYITQEDFIQEQIASIKGWKKRALDSFDNRYAKPAEMTKQDIVAFQDAMSKAIPNNKVYKGVEVNYNINKDGMEVNVVRAVNQKQGAGTSVMREINDLADKHGVPLTVHAIPSFASSPSKLMTQEQLENWYKKLGYEVKQVGGPGFATVMTRPPKAGAGMAPSLDSFREKVLKELEPIGLHRDKMYNQAMDLALGDVRSTFGHYAVHSNLDETITKLGVPFWYFPSRSIPFYIKQQIAKPRLGMEMYYLKQDIAESKQPQNLFGYFQIPGTQLWYNPLRISHLFRSETQGQYTPQDLGMVDGAKNLLQKVGIGLGPQWSIAEALVTRALGKQVGDQNLVTGEAQTIIPQQQWIKALAHMDIPGISQIAGIVSEPFDGFLRAVYGDETADSQLREVEKYIVDKGFNPRDLPNLPPEVLQAAWKEYYIRQLASIPFGTVKPFTKTEQDRLAATNAKLESMGITDEQRAAFKEAGESPLVGMRQDQIDAFYKDIPGEKLTRYIRPATLTPQARPYWDDYIQLKVARENSLAERIDRETKYDTALQNMKITPREWKAMYRTSYTQYIAETKKAEELYPKAMKTDTDWQSFKDSIGSTISPRNPDDIKLDEYYKALDSGNFDNPDIPGEFDYKKYRATQQVFLATLPQYQIDYINSRKDKNKTPLRVSYTQDMAKVQPYYDLQDSIMSRFPPEVSDFIDRVSKVPDATKRSKIMASYPAAVMALRQVGLAKKQFLAQHPDIKQILRYWNS